MLPVLEYEPGKYMAESLDIIKFIDNVDGPKNASFAPKTEREDIKKWTETYNINNAYSHLVLRCSRKMPVADWDEAGLTYHANKYKAILAEPFDETIREGYLKTVNDSLVMFELLLHSTKALNSWGLSYDDLVTLPYLRNVTCVKGIVFPLKVAEYMKNVIPEKLGTYSAHAVEAIT